MVLGATAATAQDLLEPVEGDKGASILGPRNLPREQQSPDLLRPPATDNGGLDNLKFSFADTPMKIRDGGWSRQVTQRELPVSTTMAGVNMRLTAGGVRELHWHKEAEWAFVLAGQARITAVDSDGRNFVADVGMGDLWYFPPGIPHSIQGLSPGGTEFLLAFPNGGFSEDSTFAITDMFAHMPKEALAKNFGFERKALDNIPHAQRFIFRAAMPPSLQADTVEDPQGHVPRDMAFRLGELKPQEFPGGSVRIVDTRNFKIAEEVAAALVDVKPGHMREMHWHPNADEWQFYASGQARMTVFAAEGNARTFDYRAGDVGYVPKSMPHYVENTGSAPLRFLELFHAPRFMDVSLTQWMALTPHELVAAHLDIAQNLIDGLPKEKRPVV
jgi:oxalate decarboxylase